MDSSSGMDIDITLFRQDLCGVNAISSWIEMTAGRCQQEGGIFISTRSQ
jgi:hypothetical protein